jgi:membrane protein required for colicin V production
MNLIDVVLAILLVFGLIRGYFKGFIVEVTSLISLVLGTYIAMYFSHFASDILKSMVDWRPSVIQIVSFAITFFLVVILIEMAGKVFTKLANKFFLGGVNKILGAVFGLLKVALIASVVILIFDGINGTIPFVKKEKIESSFLYNPVKNFGTIVFPKIIEAKEKIEKK